MSRTRRLRVHGQVYFLTMRVQRGLPFNCSEVMNKMILSKIARAQAVHPVVIGDLVVMGNHLHMMIEVKDPEQMVRFIRHFKTESALAINEMMGRSDSRCSVWEEGYHTYMLPCLGSYMACLVYLHSNPIKANLVDKAVEYPGISTFNELLRGEMKYSEEVPRFKRGVYKKMEKEMSMKNYGNYYSKVLSTVGRKDYQSVEFNPARIYRSVLENERKAIQSVGSRRDRVKLMRREELSYKEFSEVVVQYVMEREESYERVRWKRGVLVVGVRELMCRSIYSEYEGKKRRKRGKVVRFILSRSARVRVWVIMRAKNLNELYDEVKEKRKRGDKEVMYPYGYFEPGGAMKVYLVPDCFWDWSDSS